MNNHALRKTMQNLPATLTTSTLPPFDSDRISFDSYYPTADPEDWYTVREAPPDMFGYEEGYDDACETYYCADCAITMLLDGKPVYTYEWSVCQGQDEEDDPGDFGVYCMVKNELAERETVK